MNFILKYLYFLIVVISINCTAQGIFPYLELKNDEDFEQIEALTVENNFNFQYLLGQLKATITYKNNSEKEIDAKFIYPYQPNQNLYELRAYVNDKVYEIQSKSISSIRKELKNIDASTLFQNQKNNQFLKLDLGKIPSNATIKVEIKIAKIIEEKNNQYQIYFPEIIVKRTESFTQINKWNPLLNGFPAKSNSKISISGNIQNPKIESNLKFTKINDFLFSSTSKEHKLSPIKYSYIKNQPQNGIRTFTENGCDYILGSILPAEQEEKFKSPREFLFVLDASGSMMNLPIATIKKLMNQILPQLKSSDKFNVLVYSTTQELFFKESQFAKSENITNAINKINSYNGNGERLLNEAIDQIQKTPFDKNYKRIIAIISDGKMNLNETIYNSLRNYAKESQFITLGIGRELDYKAMNFISLATGTLPITVNDAGELSTKTSQFINDVLNSSLYHLKIQSTQLNINETFPKNFNSYLGSQTLHFVTKDCNRNYPKKLQLIGNKNNQSFQQNFEIKQPQSSEFNEAIKFYWAKQKIEFLLKDEQRCGEMCINDGRYKKEIEKIGTDYNISTPYNLLIQKDSQTIFNNDFDSDNDGVMDIEDHCPYLKGNKFGNGCPEESLENRAINQYVEDYSNYLMETVEFDFDKAIIRNLDYKKLNEVVAIMRRNPTLKFIIEGHTDAVGSENYNLDLSQKRANAVLDYLVEKGLDRNRFSVIGKGFSDLKYKECNPATNCIEWKNFENRRVRFRVIE